MTIIRRKYHNDMEAKRMHLTILEWLIENLSDQNDPIHGYDQADAMPHIRDMFIVPTEHNWDWLIYGYTGPEWKLAWWSYRSPDMDGGDHKGKWWNAGPKQHHIAVEVPDDIIATQLILTL